MNKYRLIARNSGRWILGICGVLFLLLLIIAFTRIPFDVHRWLGSTGTEFKFTPTTIVMLGGSGMPSESNLIRLVYTKDLALFFPESKILISHPDDSIVLEQMTGFLEAFDIAPGRIYTKSHGTNTREQAIELKKAYPGIINDKIVVVSSPENMYRTIKIFKKLDYKYVGGVAAFENAMFVELGYSHRKIGGKSYVPDVSGNLSLRYNFWNYLKLEITCLRELAAIIYYRLNGWI